MSWIQQHANSHQSRLAATAVLSGAAVAGAILGYQAIRREKAVHKLKASIPDINDSHYAEKVRYINHRVPRIVIQGPED